MCSHDCKTTGALCIGTSRDLEEWMLLQDKKDLCIKVSRYLKGTVTRFCACAACLFLVWRTANRLSKLLSRKKISFHRHCVGFFPSSCFSLKPCKKNTSSSLDDFSGYVCSLKTASLVSAFLAF